MYYKNETNGNAIANILCSMNHQNIIYNTSTTYIFPCTNVKISQFYLCEQNLSKLVTKDYIRNLLVGDNQQIHIKICDATNRTFL